MAQQAKNAPYLITVNNEATEEKARNFITAITQNGIEFLKDTNLSDEQKKKKFHTFLNKNFDLKTIGRFALGRYWRGASKTQKKEYLNLFESMIVDVYARRFGEYNGQNITLTKSRPQGKRDILVSSKIVQKSGPEIALDWRVRKKKNGQFKIVDIIVEGVSMSLTQRSDFASVIQRGGGKVDVLITHLKGEK